MCILKGFPTTLAKSTTWFPFGHLVRQPRHALRGRRRRRHQHLLGHHPARTPTPPRQTTAGLQKWVFDQGTGSWELAYTLQNGLDLGQPYTVPGYPTGLNSGPGGSGLPWAPATDGLRNITGQVNPNGTVTIWAVTSTVSGGGDQGADPNKLVEITDQSRGHVYPRVGRFPHGAQCSIGPGRTGRFVHARYSTLTAAKMHGNGDGNGNRGTVTATGNSSGNWPRRATLAVTGQAFVPRLPPSKWSGGQDYVPPY